MTQGYHKPEAGDDDGSKLAIRRHTDRCFHAVEEIVEGQGYIVQGVLIDFDDVAEVRSLANGNEAMPACVRPVLPAEREQPPAKDQQHDA